VKILHVIKKKPEASTERIIELQKAGNEVTVIDLTAGPVAYDSLVSEVFSSDKVFCW
jgi:hypothetical protein